MDARIEGSAADRQLALLVEGAVDYAIVLLDPDGLVRTWNAGAARILGYSRDDIVGRHVSVLYAQEDVAAGVPDSELERAARDGSVEQEGWRIRRDGSRFWARVAISAIRDEAGALIGYGRVSHDLTDGRLREERLRDEAVALETANRELAEYRRLVSAVSDYAIFTLDTTGTVLSWNTGAQRVKGYTPDEIIGRHFSVFYSEEDRAAGHAEEVLEAAVRRGRHEEQGWRVRKDGTQFWAGVTVTAVRDDEDRLTGFAKVTRDLTNRKRGDDALKAANAELREANEELDRFAAVAAHDLTDPLRTISGFAELLQRGDLPAAEQEYARHIHASSVRLTRMLQALLTYARAGTATEPPEAVDVRRAIDEVLADLGGPIAERGAQVSVDHAAGARVLAAAGDVRLVLQNLISNAIKFADPQDPRVVIRGRPEGDRSWSIDVQDNGGGIAAEDHERVFGAFERARSSAGRAGYGLGLAICDRLVERNGGRIGVESDPPGGARFWVVLPIAGDGETG